MQAQVFYNRFGASITQNDGEFYQAGGGGGGSRADYGFSFFTLVQAVAEVMEVQIMIKM